MRAARGGDVMRVARGDPARQGDANRPGGRYPGAAIDVCPTIAALGHIHADRAAIYNLLLKKYII